MIKHLRTLWNRLKFSRTRTGNQGKLDLGESICDGEVSRKRLVIAQTRRTEHVAILGKTGTGKSSLLRSLCGQDVAGDRGFVFFDLHGDATPFLLRRVALEERRRRCDLSEKLIVIDPSDAEWSVGLNVLARTGRSSAFVQIAEFAELLKHRWHLESLGLARKSCCAMRCMYLQKTISLCLNSHRF